MVREKLKRVFEISVEIVFGIILLFIVLSISIGAIQLFRDLLALLTTKGITGHYINLIFRRTDALCACRIIPFLA